MVANGLLIALWLIACGIGVLAWGVCNCIFGGPVVVKRMLGFNI